MKLVFQAPPDLPPGARVAVFDPGNDDIGPWIAQHLDALGPEVAQISRRGAETATGWPLELMTYAAGDAVAVLAVYSFFDRTAAVMLIGVDRAWLAGHEAELVAAHRAAAPDWSDVPPLTVAELWTRAR